MVNKAQSVETTSLAINQKSVHKGTCTKNRQQLVSPSPFAAQGIGGGIGPSPFKIRQQLVPPSPSLHQGSAEVLSKALSKSAQTAAQGASTGRVK